NRLHLEARLCLIEVAHRREVLFLVHDAVPRAGRGEAGEHDLFGDGYVLVHHRAAGRGADDAADLVADRDRHLPPAFAPRADPALPATCARTRAADPRLRPASRRASG